MKDLLAQLKNKGIDVDYFKEVVVLRDIENMPYETDVSVVRLKKNDQIIAEHKEYFSFLSFEDCLLQLMKKQSID